MIDVDKKAHDLLEQALVDVRAERRVAGKSLHGWRQEAAIRAIIRALGEKQQ